MRPGIAVPPASPITTLMDSAAESPLASAGLPMMSSCTGSAPVALGPVQLTGLPSRSVM